MQPHSAHSQQTKQGEQHHNEWQLQSPRFRYAQCRSRQHRIATALANRRARWPVGAALGRLSTHRAREGRKTRQHQPCVWIPVKVCDCALCLIKFGASGVLAALECTPQRGHVGGSWPENQDGRVQGKGTLHPVASSLYQSTLHVSRMIHCCKGKICFVSRSPMP